MKEKFKRYQRDNQKRKSRKDGQCNGERKRAKQ